MSFNYVSVFDQLRNVAIVARKCPTPVLQAAYVTAFRDWCAQTQWLRMDLPGATAAGEVTYDMGNDPLLEILAIFAMSVTFTTGTTPQTLPVYVSDPTGWDPNRGPGMPRFYSYVPEGRFALFPTPDQQYGLDLTVVVQPADNVRQIPDAPLRKYSSVIEAGALAQLLNVPGQPWTDQRRAAMEERKFLAGINNGKAEVQRNFNTGAQRIRPRPFVLGGTWR